MKRVLLIISLVLITSINLVQSQSTVKNKWSYTKELEQLYRLDLLPEYRTDSKVEQISSYDTTGGNDDGFSGKYSFIRKEKEGLVIADLKGPGVIHRIWTPTPTNDTVKFYFDGETVPRITIRFIDLFSSNKFPFLFPVCGNEVGGYYCYLPIPFKKSCKIVYCGEKIMFHQIQYRLLDKKTEVVSYSNKWSPEETQTLTKAVNVWKKYGDNILPEVYNDQDLKLTETEITIAPGEQKVIFDSEVGGRIAGLEISPSDVFSGIYKDIMIIARWDDESNNAINAPAADFFGFAYGKPSMQSLMAGSKNNRAYNYFPMPFENKARISLKYEKRNGVKQEPITIKAKVWMQDKKLNSITEGKFYASWNRDRDVPKGKPYPFLEYDGKGHYVGTILQAQGRLANFTIFFEGDDSTAVDGEMRMHGTGSEDYFNGGWYALPNRWDKAFSLPVHGCLDYNIPFNRTGGFRFFLSDKVSFEKQLNSYIEHGPEGNRYDVDYTSVAFYYANLLPQKNLIANESLREVFVPREHFFHRDLTEFIIGGGTTVDSNHGYLTITTQHEGFVRLNLEEIPHGEYDLLVTYGENNQGADFSVWQRQSMISEWFSTYNKDKVKIVDNEFIRDRNVGRIKINDLLKDVTFKVRKTDKGNKFCYLSIRLKKVD